MEDFLPIFVRITPVMSINRTPLMSSNSWRELKELASIVRRAEPVRTQVYHQTASSSHEYIKLYRHLTSNEAIDESDAAERLGKSAKDPSYINVRTMLRKILLNTLFVMELDEANLTTYSVAVNKSNRDLFLLKTLAGFGARLSAREIAIPMLRTATKYEFLTNKLEILTFLRGDSAILGDSEARDKYHHEFLATLIAIRAEGNALAYLEEIQSEFAASGSEKPELQALVGQYVREVREACADAPTFAMQLSAFRLEAIYYQIGLDFERALEVATRAQAYIESKAIFNSPIRVAEFALKRIVCLLHLRRYDEGIELVKTNLRSVRVDTGNWFAMMEYRFLLEMHSLQFIEARSTLELVFKSTAFAGQQPHQRQKWDLYRLYLDYGEHRLLPEVQSVKDLLDIIPAFNKDKAGYNFAVLVLHVLYLIERGELLKVSDRTAALRNYRLRYLKDKKGAEPELNFLQLLLLLEGASFDVMKIRNEARKILDQLQAGPTSSAAGPQILPYDYLWSRIMESLKT